MRVIVAGSRNATEAQVNEALDRCPWIGFASAIVSGTARGADEFGERWAAKREIEVHRFPADWRTYGKRAGPIRNRQMAQNADGLVAVWDGRSRGTKTMIEFALADLRLPNRRREGREVHSGWRT
ncbi:MAG: SLOG family protein [Deltaproteobacteria bacterium]